MKHYQSIIMMSRTGKMTNDKNKLFKIEEEIVNNTATKRKIGLLSLIPYNGEKINVKIIRK